MAKNIIMSSQVIKRQSSKETMRVQRVYRVNKAHLQQSAKSKSPIGSHHTKANLLQEIQVDVRRTQRREGSRIPGVSPRKDLSNTRLNVRTAFDCSSPTGLKSPTPLKKPSMFAKTLTK